MYKVRSSIGQRNLPRDMYHIVSYRIVSYDIMTYHIIYIMSYHISSYPIISHHVMSYLIIYHTMPCQSCHVKSYHIISYHIISYHVSYIIKGGLCQRNVTKQRRFYIYASDFQRTTYMYMLEMLPKCRYSLTKCDCCSFVIIHKTLRSRNAISNTIEVSFPRCLSRWQDPINITRTK